MIAERESITAKLCAFARAWHSNKSRGKIFDDYLAYDLMGKTEYEEMYDCIRQAFLQESPCVEYDKVEKVIKEYIAPIPLSRSLFSEKRLKAFAEQDKDVQYVICGAGYDTFSLRNENEHIQIFEIDHPDTQAYKLEKIKQLEWNIPSNVHFVSVDFENETMLEKLYEAGFDANRKTFFSILGVSYYLTLNIFTQTLKQIAELSQNGSILAFDYPIKGNGYPARVQRLEALTYSLGEVMQGGFTYSEISRTLYQLGFQIDTFLTPQKVQEYYFAEREDGLSAFENVSLLSAIYTGGYDYE